MMKYKIVLVVGIFSTLNVAGQTPSDAVYMGKNSICFMGAFGQSSWEKYWENTLKRENLNIGTNTTSTILFMSAIGITDKLNAFVALPYISTENSAGNLLGQKGIQDLSIAFKYKLLEQNGIRIIGSLGGSVPIGNYIPDFLPMSIGLQSPSLTGRLIVNYRHASGLYLTAQGGYTGRGNIKIDRDSYQAYDIVYDTKTVAIPNLADGGIHLGYLKHGLQVYSFIERFDCIGGDNIRRNDMPFPTNDMSGINLGGFIKYQPKNIGINFRYGYTIKGHNVGQAASWMTGILYQFKYKRDKEVNPVQ